MTGSYDPSSADTFRTKKGDSPNLVEGCPFISAKEIPRDGTPRTTWAGVPITTTIPRFGGLRYWFLCPRCGRRVGKLYLVDEWGCRRCHRLTYQSQHVYFSTNPLLRALQMSDRFDTLRARAETGDASAMKPLLKLACQMLEELAQDHDEGSTQTGDAGE